MIDTMRKTVKTSNVPELPVITTRNVSGDGDNGKKVKLDNTFSDIKNAHSSNSQKTSSPSSSPSVSNNIEGLKKLATAHTSKSAKNINTAMACAITNVSLCLNSNNSGAQQNKTSCSSDSLNSNRCQKNCPVRTSVDIGNGEVTHAETGRNKQAKTNAAKKGYSLGILHDSHTHLPKFTFTTINDADRSSVGNAVLIPTPPLGIQHSKTNPYDHTRLGPECITSALTPRRTSSRNLRKMRGDRGDDASILKSPGNAPFIMSPDAKRVGSSNSTDENNNSSSSNNSTLFSQRAVYHANLVNSLFDRYTAASTDVQGPPQSSPSLAGQRQRQAEVRGIDVCSPLKPMERQVCDVLLSLRHSVMAPLFIQHPELAFSSRACLITTPEMVENETIGPYKAQGVMSTGTVGRSYVVSNTTSSTTVSHSHPPILRQAQSRQKSDIGYASTQRWSAAVATHSLPSRSSDPILSKTGEAQKYAAKVVSFVLRQDLFDEVLAKQSLLININYENVLKVSDLFVDDTRTYIAILTCLQSKGNVTHYLGRLDSEPNRLRHILYSIGVAVRMLHSHQIYHHNIKPENVLQTSAGGYCLADAGLDKLFTAQSPEALMFNGELACLPPELFDTQGGVYARACAGHPSEAVAASLGVCLTASLESAGNKSAPAAAPSTRPEQEKEEDGHQHTNQASPMSSLHTLAGPQHRAQTIKQSALLHNALAAVDVWGLGILAYRLAYGEQPIDIVNKSFDAARRAICDAELTFPTSKPACRFTSDLQSLITRCLDKCPSQRPSLTEFLTDTFFDDVDLLKRLSRDQPSVAPAHPFAYQSRRSIVQRSLRTSFCAFASDMTSVDTPISTLFQAHAQSSSSPVVNWEAEYSGELGNGKPIPCEQMSAADLCFHDEERSSFFEKCRQCGYIPESILSSGRLSQMLAVRLRHNINELFALNFMKQSILKRLGDAVGTKEEVYRLRRQLAISRKINHPNVLSYIDIVDDSKGLCFVLHPYKEYSCISTVPPYVCASPREGESNKEAAHPAAVEVGAGKRNSTTSNCDDSGNNIIHRARPRTSLSSATSNDNSSRNIPDAIDLTFFPMDEAEMLADDRSSVRPLHGIKAALLATESQSPRSETRVLSPQTQSSPCHSLAKEDSSVWGMNSSSPTAIVGASPSMPALLKHKREQTAESSLLPRPSRRGGTSIATSIAAAGVKPTSQPSASPSLQSFLLDILHGLAHLHDNGIAHLHLVPSSIFKSSNSDVYKIGNYGASFVLVEELVQSFQTNAPIYSLPAWLQQDLPLHPFHVDTFFVGLLAASAVPALYDSLWPSVCVQDGSSPFSLKQTLQVVRGASELPEALKQFIELTLSGGTSVHALLRHPLFLSSSRSNSTTAATRGECAGEQDKEVVDAAESTSLVSVTEEEIAAAIQCQPETCDEMRMRDVLGSTTLQEMDFVQVPLMERMAAHLESSILMGGVHVDDVLTEEEMDPVAVMTGGGGADGVNSSGGMNNKVHRVSLSMQASGSAPASARSNSVTARKQQTITTAVNCVSSFQQAFEHSHARHTVTPAASRCCSASVSNQVIVHEYEGTSLKCVKCGADILAVVFYCMTCADCVRCGKCAVTPVDAEGHSLVPLILHSITHERSGVSLAKMFRVSNIQNVHVLEELEMRENLPVGSLSQYLTSQRTFVRNSIVDSHSHRVDYYDYDLEMNANDVSMHSASSAERSVTGGRSLGHVLPVDCTCMTSISLSMSTDSNNYGSNPVPSTAPPLLSKTKSKLFSGKGLRSSSSNGGDNLHGASKLSMSQDAISFDSVTLGSPVPPPALKRHSVVGGVNLKFTMPGKNNVKALKQQTRLVLPKAEEFEDFAWQQEIERCRDGELPELLLFNLRFTEIPSEVYNPPPLHVVHLDLSQNNIEFLPHELSFLIHLRKLIVSYNKLVRLPDSLGNLCELEVFDASHNALTDLPQSFVHLISLESIALDYNNFAAIPESLLSIMGSPGVGGESMTFGSVCDQRGYLLAHRHRAQSSHAAELVVPVPCPPIHSGNSSSVATLSPRLGAIYLAANDRLCTFPTVERMRRFRSLKIALDNEPSLYRHCSSLKLNEELPNLTISWNKIYPDEIIPLLFCGSLRSAQSQMVYKKLSISYVLTVGRELVPVSPEGGTHRVIVVDDIPGADIMSSFTEACAFIDESQARGRGCLVHCFAGLSRSATTVIAYLMIRKKMRLDEAYMKTKEGRPAIFPNKGFLDQLVQLDKELFPTDPRPLDMSSLERSLE